jgi:hypothetical protein
MNRGQRAITIDEVPLDWCLQPGIKLDFRSRGYPSPRACGSRRTAVSLRRGEWSLQPVASQGPTRATASGQFASKPATGVALDRQAFAAAVIVGS